MAVERDKSRREGILLRMSTRDSVPLRVEKENLKGLRFINSSKMKPFSKAFRQKFKLKTKVLHFSVCCRFRHDFNERNKWM